LAESSSDVEKLMAPGPVKRAQDADASRQGRNVNPIGSEHPAAGTVSRRRVSKVAGEGIGETAIEKFSIP